MSPNSEQFPKSEQPNQLSIDRVDPNQDGHLQGIPYDNEPIDHHYPYNEEHTVDTGQIEQVLTNPNILEDGRLPARELPTPEKSKKGIFVTAGVLGASALVALGAWLGNSGDGENKNNLPSEPTQTNAGPAAPGSIETTPSAPSATPTAENKGGLGTDTYSFRMEDGSFKSHDELVESIKVPVGEYKDSIAAQNRFYELMEERTKYFPTKDEVHNNLNIPKDQQLTDADYKNAAKLYRNTYNGLFEVQGGGLFTFLEQLGSDAVDMQLANMGESYPAKPKTDYAVDIKFDTATAALVITDNVLETNLAQYGTDSTSFLTGNYALSFTGFGPDKSNDQEQWLFGDRVVVTKTQQ